MATGISKQTEYGFFSKVAVNQKAQEASYLVAQLIAQKSHAGGENLTMPPCKIIGDKMPEQDAVREMDILMACQMMLKKFCVINGKITVSLSRLMSQQISPIKVRFVNYREIEENFFSCKELTWENCVGICNDGVPSMVGSIRGFASLVKIENPQCHNTLLYSQRGAGFKNSWR
jgi:hypothetical protein